MARQLEKQLGDAFPSSPVRPPNYSLAFFVDGERTADYAFCGTYAAKHFFEAVINDRPYKWLDDRTIETSDGVKPQLRVRGSVENDLEEIIEHEYTELEEAWALPLPYDEYAQSLARGVKHKIEPKEEQQPQEKKPKEKKPKKERKSPPVPDGLITIQDICAEIGMEPVEARKILRKNKTPKPDHGRWAWDEKGAKQIKKELKA